VFFLYSQAAAVIEQCFNRYSVIFLCVGFLQVIQYRNELMHSCEFRVKDEWMRHYWTALKHFVQQLRDVPQMATAGQQIENVSVFVHDCS